MQSPQRFGCKRKPQPPAALMMFGFWVPRSPTIGAAFADTTKLSAPIKPRPTKRIVKLLYWGLPTLFETPLLLFCSPFNFRAALAAGLAVRRETELSRPLVTF